MITYYPYFQHVIEEFRHMGGGQSGILQGIIAPMVKIPPEPYLRSMTGSMPNYHKLICCTVRVDIILNGLGCTEGILQ